MSLRSKIVTLLFFQFLFYLLHRSLKDLYEKVADLLNENKEQGSYKIDFNAVNLPSGIYIAKLETGSKVQTIKMSLLK